MIWLCLDSWIAIHDPLSLPSSVLVMALDFLYFQAACWFGVSVCWLAIVLGFSICFASSTLPACGKHFADLEPWQWVSFSIEYYFVEW
jgi:hypothetical protein